jgi:ATP-binding cassette subfamily G (WHITE) protein 2 (SNQ2)
MSETPDSTSASIPDTKELAPKIINDDHGAISSLIEKQGSGDAHLINVPVSWRGLSVSAPDTGPVTVKTLPRACLNTFGIDQFNVLKKLLFPKGLGKIKTRNVLEDFTGIVTPGEMLLVLGRPGSGCSTFLRTLANRTSLEIHGDLQYSGISADEFGKRHRRDTIYLPEKDQHIAALTVRQTLRFALRMSLPSEVRHGAMVEELVQSMAQMFGIDHALDTPVGGSFSPGVSGGERKRVSIAEVLAAGSSVQCFDNSTRGLDSSTALDFVKAIHMLTKVGDRTTMATLYQAGETLYNYFDKVLVIYEGRQAFFGRTDEARKYFEDLGFVRAKGQTTAEFLSYVTDPAHREAATGSVAANMYTAADFAALFKSSPHYASLVSEIDASLSLGHPQAATSMGTASFNLSYPLQLWECLLREIQLVRGQKIVHYGKWIATIILCLIIGSEYFDVSVDAQGAFTRGGLLFFALIVNGWLQFPELFDAHTNRPVLERQAALHMYRPSAVALARVIIEIPLIVFQHCIFAIVFYFLAGLQVEAGKFFFFLFVLILSTICFSNLLRMFAYYVPTLDDCECLFYLQRLWF